MHRGAHKTAERPPAGASWCTSKEGDEMKQLKFVKYTTDDGLQLELRPVRMVLIELALGVIDDEMRADGEHIDPPTFTVKMAEGIPEETFEHVYDPENGINTLEDPDDPRATQINHARWRMHEKALAKKAALVVTRQIMETFKQGVEFEMNAEDGWEEEVMAKSLGKADIPPDEPGNETERAFLWLWYTQLSPLDSRQIYTQLTALSQGNLLKEDYFQGMQGNVQSAMAGELRTNIANAFATEGGDEAEAPVDSE